MINVLGIPSRQATTRMLALASMFSPSVMLGCAEVSPEVVTTDAAQAPPDASTPDAGLRECDVLQEGTTRACACPAGAQGTQVCINGKYLDCRCLAVNTGSEKRCKAGYYVGDFRGAYKPGIFGLGLFPGLFEFDIAGAPSGEFPAWSMTLREANSGAGEFQTFGVENGCLIGSAKAGETNNPFMARLNGSLDCQTGLFSGTVTGSYNFVESGLSFNFTGPMSAVYQVQTSQLSDGAWNVQEPPTLTGESAGGGGGTWEAAWVAEAAPPGSDPCATLDAMLDGGSAAPGDASQGADGGVGGDGAAP